MVSIHGVKGRGALGIQGFAEIRGLLFRGSHKSRDYDVLGSIFGLNPPTSPNNRFYPYYI